MTNFDTFTNKQKETYSKIHDLNHELMNAIDPSSFVLNDKVRELQEKIAAVQANCDHIWEDGFCIVCGKEEFEGCESCSIKA